MQKGTGGTLEQVEKKLAAAGLEKLREGKKLSREELGAVRRLEKRREEQRRWEYYRTIPQKHWKEMAGRQLRQLREQADIYGLPFAGPVVDLPTMVRALHEFLAKNAAILAAGRAREGADPMLDGPGSPALEEYRREKAKITRIEREILESKTVRVDELRGILGLLATIMRNAGETLGRLFGEEARLILDEALNDYEEQVRQMIAVQSPDRANPYAPEETGARKTDLAR